MTQFKKIVMPGGNMAEAMEHRIRHNAPRGAIVTENIDDIVAWSDVCKWVPCTRTFKWKVVEWKNTCLFQGNIHLFVLVSNKFPILKFRFENIDSLDVVFKLIHSTSF